ncbi:MAG TPA: uracil-DNA glycosylase [Tepidisphaeraceae bacterium]|nr:uracil-DNA glycosylase [Tepidisphaeraceae bacterium]
MANEQTKARVNLWLRSERAMGVGNLLPRPKAIEPGESAPSEESEGQTPATGLFGGEEVAEVNRVKKSPGLPIDLPVLSLEEKRAALAAMDVSEVRGCTRCVLCKGRTQTVFGEGDPDARVFFIGEGPGENEDQTGRPFVGRAGHLLDKMIAGMGLRRENVYIANVVKCRPPGNRTPAPDEVAACAPFLVRQLEIIRPKVIVTLGLPAARFMLEDITTMGRARGQWRSWRGIKLMPTYHPSYLLRSYTEENRQAVWNDLKAVMAELGLPVRGK